MNERIKRYVDGLFRDAPKKRRVADVQEELTADLNEKYEDLVRQGRGEDEAFNAVAAGVGDIDTLIRDISEADRKNFAEIGERNRLGSVLLAAGIALCLFAAVAGGILGSVFDDVVGSAVSFSLLAVAVFLVVYGALLRKKTYKREDDSFVEEYKEKVSKGDKSSRLAAAASSALWTLIVLLYFALSFLTGRWGITWIVFLVGSVLQQVIRSVVTGKLNLGGILWTSTVIVYLAVSFTFGNWHISWLIFLAAAAVQQGIRVFRIWREDV